MKKFFPYILILIVFVGLFAFVPTRKAQADSPNDIGTCTWQNLSFNSCKAHGAESYPPASAQDPDKSYGTCIYQSNTRAWCASNNSTSSPSTFNLTTSAANIIGTCKYTTDHGNTYQTTQDTQDDCLTVHGSGNWFPGATQTPPLQSGQVYCDYGAFADGSSNIGIEDSAPACQGSQGTVTSTPPGSIPSGGTATTGTTDTPEGKNSAFVKAIQDDSCGALISGSIKGCIKTFFYYVIYLPSAVILEISAIFFNALISISLSSKLFRDSTFIPTAWGVVRDLSNLFFILVLLWIAIKLILDLGGHDTKKTIAKVVIIALLINFSMFFTEVVIDTSNVLALIFYNKLEVTTKTPDGHVRDYKGSTDNATGSTEKDISGGMYNGFDPTSKMDQKFWDATKKQGDGTTVPVGIMVSVILISSTIMLFAAYAFFVSGIYFVSRMIELWILIIFSPFAFMSSTVPLLSGVESIGWDGWSKRLLKVSFMAPIFMFFMYLIFLLLKEKGLFENLVTAQSWSQTVLLTLIPAMLILILLIKATKFAKKWSGEFGEYLMKGAKMVGGLALGAATGGTAMLATGTLGNLASRAASSKLLNENQNKKGLGGMAARMALKSADYGSKSSFDLRNVPGAKSLAKAGGLNLESTKAIGLGIKEGGYQKRRAENVKKRQERAKSLEVREDEGLKQNLNQVEQELQTLLSANAHELEQLDKRIKGATENAAALSAAARSDPSNTAKQDAARAANDTVVNLREEKKALKNGKANFTRSSERVDAGESATVNFTNNVSANGRSINKLEDDVIPHAHDAIEKENRARKVAYAERLQNRHRNIIAMSKAAALGFAGNKVGIGATLGLGALGHPIIGGALAAGALSIPFTKEDKRGNREAAHKIIMGVKLDSGDKH